MRAEVHGRHWPKMAGNLDISILHGILGLTLKMEDTENLTLFPTSCQPSRKPGCLWDPVDDGPS